MEEIMLHLDFANLGWKIALPLILMLADIITGVIQAMLNNDFHSSVMREGLYHKALEILVMGLGYSFHFAFGLKAISTVIVIYITLMEISSILENLTKAHLDLGPLSKILRITGNNEIAEMLDKKSEAKKEELSEKESKNNLQK